MGKKIRKTGIQIKPKGTPMNVIKLIRMIRGATRQNRIPLLRFLLIGADLRVSITSSLSLGKNCLIKKAIKRNDKSQYIFSRRVKRTFFSSGAEEKARVTVRVLKRKMREYEQLKVEIEQLQEEAK